MTSEGKRMGKEKERNREEKPRKGNMGVREKAKGSK